MRIFTSIEKKKKKVNKKSGYTRKRSSHNIYAHHAIDFYQLVEEFRAFELIIGLLMGYACLSFLLLF